MRARSTAGPTAITGIGCLSGFGSGVTPFEDGIFDGRTTIDRISSFDTSERRAHVAGTLAPVDVGAFIAPTRLRRIDRIGRLAVVACHLALADAGLGDQATRPGRVGVALGSSTAGLHSIVGYLDAINANGPAGASAMDFSNTVGNAAASLCAIECGLHGPNATIYYKEASALAAVDYAITLSTGEPATIVTGGVEDFDAVHFAIHDSFGVFAHDAGHGEMSRPFGQHRNGFVAGSGAFLLVLEDEEAALQRGASVRGHIAGLGATSAVCGVNKWPTDPGDLISCMRQALDSAGLQPRDVGVVFAAANSTQDLDRTEARALADVFGARGVPVVALKGALGEYGAVGAAGIVAATAAFRRGIVPPTLGAEDLDPDCEVDLTAVGGSTRALARPVALVNSVASGGANFSVVVTA
ncbi:MAG: beta-ketoacyl synthase N-terminal-like domain-containing protein [Acidobacteriota bacterium]